MPYLGPTPPAIPISGTDIQAGTIETANIADDAVTLAKIADVNVSTAKIANNAVTLAKIADVNVTTAKIANDAITTAKIADVNVTTAKIADVNVTTAKIADDAITLAKLAAGTDGELITWDASGNPAAVAVGTSTHVLTSNGTGAAPTFQEAGGGGLIFLDRTVTSGGPATVEWTNIGTEYDTYLFLFSNLGRLSGTGSYATGWQVGYGASPTWITSGYDGISISGYNSVAPVSQDLAGGDDAGAFIRNSSSYSGDKSSGEMIICGLTDTNVDTQFRGYCHNDQAGSTMAQWHASGISNNTTAMTAIRLMIKTGTMTNNAVILRYGFKQS